MYDVVVVGAGFAGAVFAREAAEAGRSVLVIEKRNHVAGNMFEECGKNGIRVHRYGPHIFHTNDKNTFKYLQQFAQWHPYEHRVLGMIDNQCVPIPINFSSIQQLFPQEAASSLVKKLSTTYEQGSRVSVFDLLQSSEKNIRAFGDYVYKNVFENYTAKQWGVPASQVDKSTLNRVPVVIGYDDRYFSDVYQFMPDNGYTALFKALFDHPSITVQLNTNAMEKIALNVDADEITFEGKTFEGLLFYCGALDELLSYRYGALPYRALDMKFEEYEKEFFQQGAVVNYPNDEKYTRITEFKYITGQNSSTATTIMKEYPLPYNPSTSCEAFYPIANEQNQSLYEKYAQLAGQFSNIVLCGRLAEYKYYNMDAVVANALRLSAEVFA